VIYSDSHCTPISVSIAQMLMQAPLPQGREPRKVEGKCDGLSPTQTIPPQLRAALQQKRAASMERMMMARLMYRELAALAQADGMGWE
jgi:Spy/CpxP family protein refolding chaperone